MSSPAAVTPLERDVVIHVQPSFDGTTLARSEAILQQAVDDYNSLPRQEMKATIEHMKRKFECEKLCRKPSNIDPFTYYPGFTILAVKNALKKEGYFHSQSHIIVLAKGHGDTVSANGDYGMKDDAKLEKDVVYFAMEVFTGTLRYDVYRTVAKDQCFPALFSQANAQWSTYVPNFTTSFTATELNLSKMNTFTFDKNSLAVNGLSLEARHFKSTVEGDDDTRRFSFFPQSIDSLNIPDSDEVGSVKFLESCAKTLMPFDIDTIKTPPKSQESIGILKPGFAKKKCEDILVLRTAQRN